MGFIFKGILAVIWLLVVPCLAGGFYFRREKRISSGRLYTAVCHYRAAFPYHDFYKAATSSADRYIWSGGRCAGISGCLESL